MARINSTGVIIELIAAVVIVVLLAINIKNPPSVLFNTRGLGVDQSLGYLGAFLIAGIASLDTSCCRSSATPSARWYSCASGSRSRCACSPCTRRRSG